MMRIVCAVTGRSWPPSYRPWIAPCALCGALICKWTDCWLEIDGGAVCATPCPGHKSAEIVVGPHLRLMELATAGAR